MFCNRNKLDKTKFLYHHILENTTQIDEGRTHNTKKIEHQNF